MGWPKHNSRKGLMYRVTTSVRDLERDWRPHRGDWQPSPQLCRITKMKIAHVRELLNQLEGKL